VRVLGIDPGTRHLGWGVLESSGTRITHVAHGVIDADEKATLADRLVFIDAAIEEVLLTHRPTAAAVEGIFFAKDAQSAAKLGHARGVVLLRLAKASLPIREFPPALVKRTVVGRGAADKRQVLRLASPPRVDAADALAIALTHLQVARFDAALAASRRA
jgi:crossover junction endodeoxyribonuclease RuvC